MSSEAAGLAASNGIILAFTGEGFAKGVMATGAQGALILVGLLAWGLHATLPWHLSASKQSPPEASGPRALARWWCRLALVAWTSGVIALAVVIGADPDRAWHAGIGPLPAGTTTTLWLSLSLGALAGADLLLALARERMERLGWWLTGGLGLLALGVVSWTQELLRSGGLSSGAADLDASAVSATGAGSGLAGLAGGAGTSASALLLASLLRSGVALAAADLVLPPSGRRPRWSPFAGIALGLYVAVLPAELRQLLILRGDLLTLCAGSGALLLAPMAPPGLRRVAVAAGLLLAALGLARVGSLALLL